MTQPPGGPQFSSGPNMQPPQQPPHGQGPQYQGPQYQGPQYQGPQHQGWGHPPPGQWGPQEPQPSGVPGWAWALVAVLGVVAIVLSVILIPRLLDDEPTAQPVPASTSEAPATSEPEPTPSEEPTSEPEPEPEPEPTSEPEPEPEPEPTEEPTTEGPAGYELPEAIAAPGMAAEEAQAMRDQVRLGTSQVRWGEGDMWGEYFYRCIFDVEYHNLTDQPADVQVAFRVKGVPTQVWGPDLAGELAPNETKTVVYGWEVSDASEMDVTEETCVGEVEVTEFKIR